MLLCSAGLRRNSLDSVNSQSVSQSVSVVSQRFSWWESRKQSLDSQTLHHSDLDRLQVENRGKRSLDSCIFHSSCPDRL